ncbi:MAG: AraC family transcriptional regulator [Bacteroidia bacterium]|nr:AraC family transcriptional regulator [Bacteroidia bacterium]
MIERFIERGTAYPLQMGTLMVYETNTSCKNVKFFFEQNVLTLMLKGHKTVVSDNLKIEFFPGTLFIPQANVVQTVHIPEASFYNPTKCLVLEIDPAFLQTYYEEILYLENHKELLHSQEASSQAVQHFCSNDKHLVAAFIRLYEQQLGESGSTKDLIDSLVIKEMLARIFNTEGLALLRNNFVKSVPNKKIQKSLTYIKGKLDDQLTVQQLADVSGYGLTTFYKKFREITGMTPVDYILNERIKQSKIMIQKNKLSLKEIAFKCGFNSYEYFCSSFRKLEQLRPSEFKKATS